MGVIYFIPRDAFNLHRRASHRVHFLEWDISKELESGIVVISVCLCVCVCVFVVVAVR